MEQLRLTYRDVSYDGHSAESFLDLIHCGYASYALRHMHEKIDWFRELWTEFRFIKPGFAPVRHWEPACWQAEPELWEKVRAYNLDGYNIFIGVLPRLGQKGTAADVAITDTLWADVDGKDFKGGKKEAWASIHKAEIPKPTIIVDSGHGYHCYWNLRDYCLLPDEEARLKFSGYLNGIAKHIGGDYVHDVSRMMRMAYTINWKDKPVIAETVETNKGCIPLAEFEHLWIPVKTSRVTALTFDKDLPVMDVTKLPEELRELILHPPQRGERSEATFKVGAWLKRLGYTPGQVLAVMKAYPIGERYYDKRG